MNEHDAKELAREIKNRFHHPLYADFDIEVEQTIGSEWKITVI